LGILQGRVLRFDRGDAGELLQVPHIGWNQFHITNAGAQSTLLKGIPDKSYAYFVHSFYVQPADEGSVLAQTDYGIDFASVVGKGKVFGAQPHPEKSQEVGLRLLRNYAEIVRTERDRFSGN
jgi:glutamine amidotransferase